MMRKMLRWGRRLLRDDSGLTTVEYAVAGALVTAAVLGAFIALGSAVSVRINNMKDVVASGG